MNVHPCPWCRCDDGSGIGRTIGRVDPAAPFYSLVLDADRLLWADTTAKHAAARTARKDVA